MELHKILQGIMDEKNITIADMARLCDLPDSTVRGIISRKQKTTSLEVAYKLSDGLNISLERLNGLPEKENPPAPVVTEQRDALSKYEVEGVLIALGLIQDGEHIADDDLRFLESVIAILEAWFEQKRKGS